MSILTSVSTEELVMPMGPPMSIYRTVERRGESYWVVAGWSEVFSTGLEALMEIREEAALHSRYPVRVVIEWKGIPAGSPAPTTGTSL